MNTKIPKEAGTIYTALLSSMLIVVAITGGIEPREAIGQNATATATGNQTSGAGAQNQTQMALGNLTLADFEPVTTALNSVRDSILGNSTEAAFISLNDADDALFSTAQGEDPSATVTIVALTEPIRNHIDSAQEALLQGDLPKALNERNSAEVELVKITKGLSDGEEEPDDDEDAEEE